ncbi:hypothetical protein ACNFIC_00680 [Pseudomonas sp. NY15463]|uniref:hypothetical protein n=1 Tax=Pseudomonas sp. NY15463 TaxID=3400361 RepID=UPI003A8AD225
MTHTTTMTPQEAFRLDRMLTPGELAALDARLGAQADAVIAQVPEVAQESGPKSSRGRPAMVVQNPFHTHYGCMTDDGRYPAWALSVLEGVARLDWHDRPQGKGGKSMPLRVSLLARLLETLPEITNEAVRALTGYGVRHARRYVKALSLIVPRLMEIRPHRVVAEMATAQDLDRDLFGELVGCPK